MFDSHPSPLPSNVFFFFFFHPQGNDGLGTLDEDPTEDSDGVVYNVTDDHQDDNDDDVGVEAVDLDDALARRDSHGQGQPSSHQETAI